ncbi:MAG: succinate dehydrogenase, cytochrome b556 subunit [Legionellales bacterium]|nr:succinate dehydrogenase, cytochrome b556 subunit [Legionellales bacterium]
MQNKKPIYLNIFQFKFPFTAIVSILHRISGVILFFFIPGILYSLDLVLDTKETYDLFVSYVYSSKLIRFTIWFFALAFFYHTVAGIRHLLMDFGKFESKLSASISGKIIFLLVIIFAIWSGRYLWEA